MITKGKMLWSFINEGDVTRDDSQRRFLAQHSVASWNNVGTIRNNVATLYCAKHRRCESSRVISPQLFRKMYGEKSGGFIP